MAENIEEYPHSLIVIRDDVPVSIPSRHLRWKLFTIKILKIGKSKIITSTSLNIGTFIIIAVFVLKRDHMAIQHRKKQLVKLTNTLSLCLQKHTFLKTN